MKIALRGIFFCVFTATGENGLAFFLVIHYTDTVLC